MKFKFYLNAWAYCFRNKIHPNFIKKDGKGWIVHVPEF